MEKTKREMAALSKKDKKVVSHGDPAKTFAKNVERLVQMSGKTRKEVAAESGVDYQWFRRISTTGLTRIQSVDARLEQLRKLFRLDSVDDFWLEDLIVFRVKRTTLPSQADANEEEAWKADGFMPVARKLYDLLSRYDSLEKLINQMHATMPPPNG